MTKQVELAKLKKIRKKHGADSNQYKKAYKSFTTKYGPPGLQLHLPTWKKTNEGSPGDGSDFFGARKRKKKKD